jgi:hypothetical protein
LFDVAVCVTRLVRCDIAAGTSRRRVLVESLSMAVAGLPALARLSFGWLRCIAA